MKYCPKCRMEYQDRISVCSDCQERLVDKLSVKNSYEVDECKKGWNKKITKQWMVFLVISIIWMIYCFWASSTQFGSSLAHPFLKIVGGPESGATVWKIFWFFGFVFFGAVITKIFPERK